MRASISLALLAVTTMLTLSGAGRANVKAPCSTFARPCDCAWHVRVCLPTGHIEPRMECTPTS
jgi:hypothetical protein